MRALLSVSDKRGVVEFARELAALGWEIVSTGGTADTLRKAGVSVVPIEQVTGFPEIMDGRLKTLHPKVHGGLLARRGNAGDRAALAQHGITPIDLVAVNLYPFRETVARPNVGFEQAIEQIDIGGPSMLRSAAKNHQDVIVVVDPDDYPVVISALKSGALAPGVSPGLRRELAAKVFAHTAAYDATIHTYLMKDRPGWPERITLALERRQELRYGENPHQAAALYAADEPGVRDLEQLHGKELSLINLLVLADYFVVQQSAGRRRGARRGGAVERVRSRRVRHHQTHYAVRHRAGPATRRGIRAGARDRPHLGVRVGDRLQRECRPCDGRRAARAVRRGGGRASVRG